MRYYWYTYQSKLDQEMTLAVSASATENCSHWISSTLILTCLLGILWYASRYSMNIDCGLLFLLPKPSNHESAEHEAWLPWVMENMKTYLFFIKSGNIIYTPGQSSPENMNLILCGLAFKWLSGNHQKRVVDSPSTLRNRCWCIPGAKFRDSEGLRPRWPKIL